jgi:hypothetical protein
MTDMNDLIDKLEIALLPRAGFVFRRNVPDRSLDKDGNLAVPVARRSPMPQVAWVFWVRPGSERVLRDFVQMVSDNSGKFYIKRVWHLPVKFAGGTLPEPVTEFCNPQIPATGEVAMLPFGRFFVLSNSGPLIKDILRTNYSRRTGMKPILDLPEFYLFDRELPDALNGFLWLRGENLVPVLDDYLRFAEADSEQPDPEFLVQIRPEVENEVRRTRFRGYPSKASMPPSVRDGAFEDAVQETMRERWRRVRTNFTQDDRQKMEQLKAMAQLIDQAYVQLELMNNYIRFQTKLLMNW